MLILNRKIGEAITLHTTDGVIEIEFIEQTKKETSVGIRAPKNVPIYRNELLNKIKKTNIL